MLSVIIVDQDLVEAVKGYGKVLDGTTESNTYSSSFNKLLNAAQLGIADKEELKNSIFEATKPETLLGLNDKEFEPSFNLAIHVLAELYGGVEQLLTAKPEFISTIVSCAPLETLLLRDRKLIKLATILLILTNVFNLLPEQLKVRLAVIEAILKVVDQLDLDFSLIQHLIGDHLILWLEAAGALESAIKTTFWNFIRLDNNTDLATLELVKTFTRKFTIDSVDQAELLATTALRSSVVDVSFLVSQNVAQALAQFGPSSAIVAAFEQYSKGQIVADAPAPLDAAKVLAKLKMFALAKFLSSSGKNQFAYADIPADFAANKIELETLLVNAIKSGVIEGKLNQINETFYLTRANHVIHAGVDNSDAWTAVEETLKQWKLLLHNIHQVVNTARDNIVNTQG